MSSKQPCGWVDRVGGNSEGGKCWVSLGDEVASTVLNRAVLAHKKRLRGAANYRPNFLDIFVLFFPLPLPLPALRLRPSEVSPSKKRQRLLGNRLNCPAFATVIATAEPPWGWWWAGPAFGFNQPHTHEERLYLSWGNDYRTLVPAALC